MELDQIQTIITMMKENDLAEFSMEENGLKIHIKRSPEGVQPTVTVSAPAAGTPPAALTAVAAAPAMAPIPDLPAEDVKHVTSPMVGTFYRSPSPETAPYVNVGDSIAPGQVICIIEAMKLMNEIKSEVKGKIIEIQADNAEPVEFGQVLFVIEPAL